MLIPLRIMSATHLDNEFLLNVVVEFTAYVLLISVGFLLCKTINLMSSVGKCSIIQCVTKAITLQSQVGISGCLM